MSSQIGKNISVQIFGQSHSEGIGVVIDGLPSNYNIDLEEIMQFIDRRKGGKNAYSTQRTESDTPKIISGLVDGKTCGAPLCAVFENNDTKSKDYSQFKVLPRPSHADYNAMIKYSDANDIRGGGHFSGRLTLPLCFAGALCKQILKTKSINIGAHIKSIGEIEDCSYDAIDVCVDDLISDGFPTIDSIVGSNMEEFMCTVAQDGDSIGGTIECAIIGMPIGVGEPMFDGIENRIATAIFGIPAIKGIEFGAGFDVAKLRGSEHNDPYHIKDGNVVPKTNNAGGVIGGITTGLPIIFKVAVKPTPSISIPQQTINLETKTVEQLEIKGRHDPCIVPRAVPVIEAVTAIVALDLLLDNGGL